MNPLQRRTFLKLAVGSVLVVPAGRFLVACASDDSSGSSDSPAAAPELQGADIVFASSITDAHHHTFDIAIDDMASPPSSGVSGRTSTELSHSHPVTVSMADLASVASGGMVKVTTGSDSGHTHVLTLVKVAPGVDGGTVVDDGDAGVGGGGGGGGGYRY